MFVGTFSVKRKEKHAPGGSRTHDPRIRNPVLYPAELLAQCDLSYYVVMCYYKLFTSENTPKNTNNQLFLLSNGYNICYYK